LPLNASVPKPINCVHESAFKNFHLFVPVVRRISCPFSTCL